MRVVARDAGCPGGVGRGARLVAAVVMVLGGANACGLVLDTAGYANGRRPDPDAASDGAATDGGATDVDAFVDAAAAADATSATSPCAGDANAFCANFDEPPVSRDFTELKTGAALYTRDDAESTTPPSSLLIVTPPNVAGVSQMLKVVARTASRVACELDVRRDALGTTRLGLLTMTLARAGEDVVVTVEDGPAGRRVLSRESLPDGGDRRATLSAPAPAAGVWERIRLELAPTSGTFALLQNGQLTAQGSLVLTGSFSSWAVALGPGEIATDSLTWKQRVDSMVCSAED